MNKITTIGLDLAKKHFSSCRPRQGWQKAAQEKAETVSVIGIFCPASCLLDWQENL
ncbi:hypothetical protein [Thiolapillus sp.]